MEWLWNPQIIGVYNRLLQRCELNKHTTEAASGALQNITAGDRRVKQSAWNVPLKGIGYAPVSLLFVPGCLVYAVRWRLKMGILRPHFSYLAANSEDLPGTKLGMSDESAPQLWWSFLSTGGVLPGNVVNLVQGWRTCLSETITYPALWGCDDLALSTELCQLRSHSWVQGDLWRNISSPLLAFLSCMSMTSGCLPAAEDVKKGNKKGETKE